MEVVFVDEFDFIFMVCMDEGWSIYFQYIDDVGLVLIGFFFDDVDYYICVGEVKEMGKKKEGLDFFFGGVIVIKFLKGLVVFIQWVKVIDFSKFVIGYLEFMICDDECCLLFMEVDFSFILIQSEGVQKVLDVVGGNVVVSVVQMEEMVIFNVVEEVVVESAGMVGKLLVLVCVMEVNIESGMILQFVCWEVQVDQYVDDQYEIIFIV